MFRFIVLINLHPLKKKERTGPPLSKAVLKNNPPTVLSGRQYYSQIQALFDPTDFLAPVLLKGKILLRKTWEDPCNQLGWDDCLPKELVEEIM